MSEGEEPHPNERRRRGDRKNDMADSSAEASPSVDRKTLLLTSIRRAPLLRDIKHLQIRSHRKHSSSATAAQKTLNQGSTSKLVSLREEEQRKQLAISERKSGSVILQREFLLRSIRRRRHNSGGSTRALDDNVIGLVRSAEEPTLCSFDGADDNDAGGGGGGTGPVSTAESVVASGSRSSPRRLVPMLRRGGVVGSRKNRTLSGKGFNQDRVVKHVPPPEWLPLTRRQLFPGFDPSRFTYARSSPLCGSPLSRSPVVSRASSPIPTAPSDVSVAASVGPSSVSSVKSSEGEGGGDRDRGCGGAAAAAAAGDSVPSDFPASQDSCSPTTTPSAAASATTISSPSLSPDPLPLSALPSAVSSPSSSPDPPVLSAAPLASIPGDTTAANRSAPASCAHGTPALFTTSPPVSIVSSSPAPTLASFGAAAAEARLGASSPRSVSFRAVSFDESPPSSPSAPSSPRLSASPLAARELPPPDCELLRKHLLREGRLTKKAARMILQQVREVFRAEPNLLELEAPFKVMGDLHGQFYDLCNLLEKSGCPLVDDRERYLFLGDYVDRGNFGTEVCLYLFALKLRDPAQVFLLRGNHESRTLTRHFNFRQECVHKYDAEIWELFMSVFDCLPVAALLRTEAGRVLCVHGGPSPGAPLLADLAALDRFSEVPTAGVLCDLLWSDPLPENTADGLDAAEMPEWFAVDFEPNPDRGCGQVFGFQALDRFLRANDLLCVVRGHEVQKSGYHEHYFHRRELEPQRTHPLLLTVFSAPNYCDMYGNQACVLTVCSSGAFRYLTEEAVPHPYYLRGLVDGLNYSLPFVFENLADLAARCFAFLGVDNNPDLQRKLAELGRLRTIAEQIRAEQNELLREDALLLRGTRLDWQEVLSRDHFNESLPGTQELRSTQMRRHLRTF
mmetsp:Transcript_28421/g.71387  ORF Transcript_28421/g.71387 Transcript_28421/m.71387 type:complete len:905 (-) Transcript_28421:113-2827(-)